ncbi:MAG: DsrE/DsrF/DrsH-like family protein [Candidatus Bathyarchaeota archaeon]|nr:DsrE/DsrF/DrsH-like family protein [Candidatus Bathyarchaeota archaeon]
MVKNKNKVLIICSKGTLDMAIPPFIITTTAAAMGMETHLYFTFWGMDIITKKKCGNLKITPIGNPSLPIPNIVGALPGMTAMATKMMKKKIKKNKIPSIQEFIKMAKDAGVKFHACTPTMNLMGITKDDLISEVDDIIGAATFVDLAKNATITLFI